MARRGCTGVLLVLLAWMIPGCATRSPIRSESYHRKSGLPAESELVVGPRGSLVPDITQLDTTSLKGLEPAEPSEDAQYRVLRPEEVKCLAAAAAPLANLIEWEGRLAASDSGTRSARAVALKRRWLGFQAVEARNRAAGRALEVFYLLAEVEANRDLLRRGLKEIDEAIANLRRLESEGIRIPVGQDSHDLPRRRMDLLARWGESETAVRRLSGQLHQLIGLPLDDLMPLWPAADLQVTGDAVDVESAVTVGMEQRADIALLRQLVRSVDADTLALVRSTLGRIDSVLGATVSSPRAFLAYSSPTGREEETHVRRHQLRELLESQERLAAEEIRDAALNVTATLNQVVLAKGVRDNRRQRVESLEQRRGTADGITVFDISAARMQEIEAQRGLVHQVIAWRIAQVKLKQAQGALALECGYELPTRRCSRNASPKAAAP